MKTITRILSLFIAAAILFGISAFSAVAAVGDDIIGSLTICDTCGENLTWSVENGILTISGEGEMNDFEEHNNFAPWVYKEYKEVVIGSGVKNIGNYAFAHGWCLENMVIPRRRSSRWVSKNASLWSTRPRVLMAPVRYSMASAMEVLPASTWARMPIAVCFMGLL